MSNVSPFYNLKGLAKGAPTPVVSNVAPTANNKGFALGTLWVDQVTNSVYVLAGFNSAGAIWTASVAGSGAITATSIVDTGDLDLSDSTGAVTFGSNPTPVNVTQVGDYNITGDITQVGNVAQTGNSVITGDLTVTGTFTNSGAGPIHLVSSDDVAEAIFLEANGGILATIVIENTLGTNAGAIKLLADAGGIQIQTPADHINLSADTATMDLGGDALVVACDGGAGKDITFTNTAGSFSVNAGESVADAIVINASGAAGALVLQAGTGGILAGNEADTTTISIGSVAPTANRTVTLGGGTQVTASTTDTINIAGGGATTNADSVKTLNLNTGDVTLGQVLTNIASGTVTSGTHTTSIASGNRAAGTMALNMATGTGTKTVSVGNADALTTINLIGTINNNTGASTGNVHINDDTGTGTIGIGNTSAGVIAISSGAGVGIDGITASHFTVTGAAADLTLSSSGGSVNITATEAVTDAIVLSAAGGGIKIGDDATLTAIDIANIVPTVSRTVEISNGIVATAHTDLVEIGGGGASTNASAIKHVTIGNGTLATGQNLIDIGSGALTSGTQTITIGNGNNAGATATINIAGGTGTKSVNIGETSDALTTIALNGIVNANRTGTGTTNIADTSNSGAINIGNSLSGAMALTTGSTFHMDAADLSYVKVTGAGKDMNVQSVGGSVNILADEAIADAIVLTASGGGIETSSVLQTLISSSQAAADAIKLNSSAGGVTVSSASTIAMTAATPIVLTSTQASGTAIQITSSNASGGVLVNTGGGVIALSSSGNVSMVAETATAASPTATVEIDARVGTATFTGYTTAAAGVQKFTITNSVSTTSKACFATATHTGAGDAQLTVGAQCLNGSMVFTVTNVGLAAVNGPILLSFWIIN